MRLLSSFSALSIASMLALTGCPAKVATVEVAPGSVSFKSDTDTSALAATAKDAKGNTLTDKQVTWSSADPAIAAVDGEGKVKPVGSGKTTITAKVDEISGTAEVTVVLVKGMKLESPALVVKVGTPSAPLKVTFNNEKGEPVENAEAKVEWSSADPNVATVGPDGTVTGVAAGSTSITAKFESIAENVVVTVNPADAPADGAAPAGGAAAGNGAAAPAPTK